MRPLALGLVLAVLLASARADPPPKVFPHVSRIRYDGRCLAIDEKDVFIFSGSFHYFRCPRELWRDRFRRIKEAGCNAVETYVPWNLHERNKPASPSDFSQIDLADLREWLRMAQDEFGLYTIVRPGPYICAEWDGGGFPRWLLPLGRSPAREEARRLGAGGSAWLRSDDSVYLEWARHWMDAVCPVIAAEQLTRKPPGHAGVILVQIENEYDVYEGVPESARVSQLRALCQAATESGIEVPLFTCLTRQCRDSEDPVLSQVFDAVNLYPRLEIDSSAKKLADLESAQPDAPAMVSELQGGWFSTAGGLLAEDQVGLTPGQLRAHTLLAIENGATILNYYMLCGGTNFGFWGSRNMTATYDYDAPIREAGGVGAKYREVAALGRMLRDHGADLMRASPVACQVEAAASDVSISIRRSRSGALYLFFRNRSPTLPQHGVAVIWVENTGEIQVNYELGPFGSEILRMAPGIRWPFDSGRSVPARRDRKGAANRIPAGVEWLPRTLDAPMPPADLPSGVRPGVAQLRNDPGGTDWVGVPGGALLPELGVLDSRPVVYRATFTLTGDQEAGLDALRLGGYPGDAMAVQVNGHAVSRVVDGVVSIGGWLRPGENSITVLYSPAGQAKIGAALQDESGLRSAALGVRRPEFESRIAIGDWRVGRTLTGVAEGWPGIGAGARPAGWDPAPLDTRGPVAGKGTLADAPSGASGALAIWHRVEFMLPARVQRAWVPWRARIDAAGDGMVYLNGHALGRYWEAGPQREFYLPECWLNFGPGKGNVLTLRLSPVAKGVRLRAVEISPYADQAEVR
jgi:hypothetical protein